MFERDSMLRVKTTTKNTRLLLSFIDMVPVYKFDDSVADTEIEEVGELTDIFRCVAWLILHGKEITIDNLEQVMLNEYKSIFIKSREHLIFSLNRFPMYFRIIRKENKEYVELSTTAKMILDHLFETKITQ